MDDNKFSRNFKGFIDQQATAVTSSEIDEMTIDFNTKLRLTEREINRCKPTLQNCCTGCEAVEMEICDVKQLQWKTKFMLHNIQSESENLYESLKNIRVNYEACVKKFDSHVDPNETIQAKISDLTTQRKKLLEELTRLNKNADTNGKKLARVRAMIVEQEEKNATQIRELKTISESAVFISPDIKKRIDAVLHETDEIDINMMQ